MQLPTNRARPRHRPRRRRRVANPEIFVVPKIKETQCFHHSSTIFHSFFPESLDNNKIYCDFSNTYVFNPLSAQYLLDYYHSTAGQQVVFTALLRCPVERSISHFSYLKASGSIPPSRSFEDHIASDPSILWRSRYELHLSFLLSQGLPINFFLLEAQSPSDPALVNHVVAALLDQCVSPTYKIPDNNSRFESMDSRNLYASKLAKSLAELLRHHQYLGILSHLKESKYVRSIFMRPRKSKYHLGNDTRDVLHSFFKPTLSFVDSYGLDSSSYWSHNS
jgi:hypothetical protein